MLGLGSSISNSGVIEGEDTRGLFSLQRTFLKDATMLQIGAHGINHDDDNNINDSDPGIRLSELSIKVNGTEVGFLPLADSNKITSLQVFTGTVSIDSNGVLTFGETAYANTSQLGLNIYEDTSVDSSDIADGDVVTVSGRVTLNDGTGNVYVGEDVGEGQDANLIGENGYIKFVFNTLSGGTEMDTMRVYIDPVNATVPSSSQNVTITQVSS
tara:strand:- start:1004 stop:1642 length:639 start_codon:yes stop_codon:yes gene_type:complete